MYSVLLTHAPPDARRARLLARALSERGYRVWAEREAQASNGWLSSAQPRAADADCVIALWSYNGSANAAVRAEALAARDQGRLINVTLDSSGTPFDFRDLPTVDLQRWDFAGASASFDALAVQLDIVCGHPAGSAPRRAAADADAADEAPQENRRRAADAAPQAAVSTAEPGSARGTVAAAAAAGATIYQFPNSPPRKARTGLYTIAALGVLAWIAFLLDMRLGSSVAPAPSLAHPPHTAAAPASSEPATADALYAQALQTADVNAARALFENAAKQGHPAAQAMLGFFYAEGQGVPKSDNEAIRWYKLAAESGNVMAQNNLGKMYEQGRGVTASMQDAIYWYRKAADQGNAPTQNNLGYMYSNGRGVLRDEQEGLRWYMRAAEQDFAPAQANLGLMYLEGRGTPRDEAEGLRWLRLAAAKGDPLARSELAKRGEALPN
ncbi:MAG: sel1 repeat family protein [Rhodocyclaceae bacterium]|nr:sel1 repeat family protein [Rhodocyclaceae bacterium]MBX3671089.1 sel1 repeat family protein [Rhodocyclaceae bacterium]